MVRNLLVRNLVILTSLMALFFLPSISLADDYQVRAVSSNTSFVFHEKDPAPAIDVSYTLTFYEALLTCGLSRVGVKIVLFREGGMYDQRISEQTFTIAMRAFVYSAFFGTRAYTGTYSFPLPDNGSQFNLNEGSYYFRVSIDHDTLCNESNESNNHLNSSLIDFRISQSDYEVVSVSAIGPMIHVKNHIEPSIQLDFDIRYYDPPFGILCGYFDVPVKIELYRTGNPDFLISSQTFIWQTCDTSFDFPLYDSGGNFELTHSNYFFKVTVDPDDTVIEQDENNNEENSQVFPYAIASGDLYFGNEIKAVIDPTSFMSRYLFINYSINGTGSWTSSWGTHPVSYSGTITSKRGTNTDGYSIDLNSNGSVVVGSGTLPGTANGLDITLYGVTLDPLDGSVPAGMKYTGGQINLPDDVTYHEMRTDNMISPHGQSIIPFSAGGPFNDPGSISLRPVPLPYPVFFHSYGLPFYIKTLNASFDFNGNSNGIALDASTSAPVYIHAATKDALAIKDFRSQRGFPSNDIGFSQGGGMDGVDPVINGQGLFADLKFDRSLDCNTRIRAYLPQTYFPRGKLCWEEFQIQVAAGSLKAFNPESMTYFMNFQGACPDGNCGDPLESTQYEINPAQTFSFGQDGGAGCVFEGGNIKSLTRWGKLNNSYGAYTYEKDDTGLIGALYIPGFIATETQADPGSSGRFSVSQYLFGSRQFIEVDKLDKVHYLNDPSDTNADDGNQYFAGINMGPQFLETGSKVESGLTELITKNPLKILFNGNSSQDEFNVTDYTKYVMRPGGITGVFNTDFAGGINIYTYKLELTRFAFRQIMNKMDDKTFIDGSLDLPFPAELHVAFSSLDITCTGDFAGGSVETEACDEIDNDNDGIIDEGCGEALSYWNIPISFLGMAFKDQGGSGVCPNPNNRKLYLDTLNKVNGVSGKITLGSFWNSNGTPEDETMTGAAQMWMDSPEADLKQGFAMVLKKGYLNHKTSYPAQTSDGFTNLVSRLDVPLFYDLAIHGHFINNSPSPEDDTFDLYLSYDQSDTDTDFNGVPVGYASVSAYRELLNSGNETLTLDPRPRAKYDWPSSKIIRLDYPLLYNRTMETTGPKFTGVKQDTDLPAGSDPIISVYSVPDYIKPDKTKLSFGISADIAALTDFHVDLSSLTGDLDTFLSNQLGIGDIAGDSLEGLLGDLGIATNLMHAVTGGDITDLIRPAMNLVLDPLTNNGQPFYVLADLIGKAHNAPSLITTQVEGLVSAARDEVEDQLAAGLNQALSDLYTGELAGLLAYSKASIDQAIDDGYISPPGDIIVLRQNLDALKSNISKLKTTLDQAADSLASARSAVETVKTDTIGPGGAITQVSNAITAINSAIASLSDYTSSNPSTNPLFSPLQTAQGYLNDAKAAIENLQIGQIADALKQAAALAGGTIDTAFLDDVEQFFDDRVDELDNLMDDATSNFQSLFANANMSGLFTDANSRLTLIQTHITSLETMLNELFTRVLEDMDNDGTNDGGYIGIVENSLNTIVSSIETLENSFTDLPVDSILPGTTWNELVSNGRDMLDTMAKGAVTALISSGGEIGTFAATIDTSFEAFNHLFADSLMGLVDAPINAALGEITIILDQALDQAVGGFLPDPDADDIKEFILSAILNSSQIQSVNNSFFQEFGFISDYIDDLSGELTSQINRMITQAVEAVSDGLNSQMADIKSKIGGSGGGLDAAKIDGYAIVSQEEVERFHLEAELKFGGDPDPTIYYAALDVTSWNAENGKGSGCSMDGTGLVDVAISTHDVTADMLGCSLGIKEALLGFTLDGPIPIGIFGYVYTSGELDFEALVLSDMGLEAGVGLIENYLGAKATGRFESYTISAAFYFGKSCDYAVLKRLDPEITNFLGDRDGLTGVYIRGSAEVPIWNNGCFLTVGVGCDIGAWYFADPPATYGGLLGGSAFGRVACVAALKGKVTLIGAKIGETYKFHGSGWGAAGVGFCEPSGWTNLAKSRSDSWCLTGDATFKATYTESWSIDGPSVDCCF